MEIEKLDIKKIFFSELNERQKRSFLAIEAQLLGYGGISEVSRKFEVSRDTISKGITELESENRVPVKGIRKAGGGRKKKLKQIQI